MNAGKSAPLEARGLFHLRGGRALFALTPALGLILPPTSMTSQHHSSVFLWSVAGYCLGSDAIDIHRATDRVPHPLSPPAVNLAIGAHGFTVSDPP
ncbi:hypothetical protein J4E08_09590 [Sagittula sp. NFXS13]|uniref:hypothetical protein n=1 Tax=Sagittula sp. NFXS13 TaxID=2819095 RepID=UPI0032E00079